MKKILKILGILAVLVIVVIAGASLALRFLLPPEKAKGLVLKHLAANLKREVKVGDVSIGLFSGLNLTDLKVSEAPDFSKGTFISSKRFAIRLALLPLFSKKIEVKQLVLDEPVIQVVRYPDGTTFNFSDLTASTTGAAAENPPKPTRTASVFSMVPEAHAAPAPATSTEPPPFKLLISHAQIQNGTVRFVDQSPARQSIAMDALNLKLSNVSMTSPFSIQMSCNARANQLLARLKMAADADLAAGSLKIKDCKVSTGGAVLSLEGKAEQLKSPRPAVAMKLNVKDLKLAALKPLVKLPPDIKLNKPIDADAQVQGNEDKLDLNFATAYGAIKLKGHGKIITVKSPQPQIQMHMESGAFPVSELLEMAPKSIPAGVTLSGQTQFSADVAGTQASSRIAAKWDGKDLAITMPEKFSKPAGTPFRVLLTGEKLRDAFNIQNLAAVLGDIEVNGSGTVQTAGKAPKFQLTAKSKPFSLQTLASFVPLLADYSPGGTAVLDVRASGTAENALVNGSLSLQNVSGRYEKSELTQIASTIGFTHQDISIPKLTGKLNGSDLSLKLTGRRLTTQPDVAADVQVTELDLAKLLPSPSAPPQARGWTWPLISEAWAAALPASSPPMKLAGTLTVGRVKHPSYDAKDMEFRWNLTDVTPDLARLNGHVEVKQGAGKLSDVDKLAECSKIVRVVFLPIAVIQRLEKSGLLKIVPVPLPSLRDISFANIVGDYAFRGGLMDIKTFDINGKELALKTRGGINLVGEERLDIQTTLSVAPGVIRGDVGNFLKDQAGRINLTFSAKGPMASPNVKFEPKGTVQNVLGNVGQGLLKNILKSPGKDAASDTTPTAAEGAGGSQQAVPEQAPPPDSGKQLEKVFKNIFK